MRIRELFKKRKTWKDVEYFNTEWKSRIKLMVSYVDENSSIVDLGCGEMWTKEYLPKSCEYYAVDYKKRSNETIICDFNKYQFPTLNVDVSFVSGCLEYVNDYKWFIKQISIISEKCILSYCTVENFPNIYDRQNKAWANNLSKNEVVYLFKIAGFELVEENITISNNVIFIFEKCK